MGAVEIIGIGIHTVKHQVVREPFGFLDRHLISQHIGIQVIELAEVKRALRASG